MLGKRGPAPRPWVELRTTVPPEIDRALTEVVSTTGMSKATVVRQALAAYLAPLGALTPDAPEQIPTTPTGGRGLAAVRNRKETHR